MADIANGQSKPYVEFVSIGNEAVGDKGNKHSSVLPGVRNSNQKSYADNFSVARRGIPIWHSP